MSYFLPREVGEGFVGLGHAEGVLFFLYCAPLVVGRVHKFLGELLRHRLALAAPGNDQAQMFCKSKKLRTTLFWSLREESKLIRLNSLGFLRTQPDHKRSSGETVPKIGMDR